MTSEHNQKIARRIVLEMFNAGRVELIDTLLSPAYVDHALPPEAPQDREGLKAMITELRQAFPDLEYTIEDQIAEGDKVVQRLTGRGTMQGDFLGMQPTGKTATWQEIHWYRFDLNGILAEHWDITDSLGMLIQLGIDSGKGS
jgi:predicted ester cyclase